MSDIAPELLKLIKKSFGENISRNDKAAALLETIQKGTATYADAENYAYEIGAALADAFQQNLSSSVLPDGRMYENIAESIIRPMLTEDYNQVSEAAMKVQQVLNEAAKIGLKAQRAELDTEKIDGIIHRVADTPQYDDAAWLLNEPVKTFSQSVVDDTLKKNVEFQAKAGLRPRLIRKAESGCCEWCSRMEGTYTCPDFPEDIYRRHERCRCTVEYDPGSGKRQNVWTKKWLEPETLIEQRKAIAGIDTHQETRKITQTGTGPENVMAEYLRTATPGVGSITYDEGYNLSSHATEIKTAQWLHDNLGGDIVLLNETVIQGQKMPDYLWREHFWDLKTLSSEKAANSAIRHGLQQIRENPGGIILDMGDKPFSESLLRSVIEKRMQWNQIDHKIDIVILTKKKLFKIIRYQKR